VVVYDFDFRRAFRRPNKAHPELVIDPDRVLPLAITRQRFKTVAWRRPQVSEIARGVEVAQFPTRHLDQIGRKALGTFAIEDDLSGLVPEVSDHARYVSLNDTVVKVGVSIDDTRCAAVVSVKQFTYLILLHFMRRNLSAGAAT
jgi:hypothetical protein